MAHLPERLPGISRKSRHPRFLDVCHLPLAVHLQHHRQRPHTGCRSQSHITNRGRHSALHTTAVIRMHRRLDLTIYYEKQLQGVPVVVNSLLPQRT